MKYLNIKTLALASLLSVINPLHADDADLAQELTNPIADLMTVPIQMTTDQNIGPDDKGSKIQTNIQPVIPFEVGDNWNLLTRTIMPVISQDKIVPGAGSQFGLGDISMSFFFSPKKSDGLIWGAGPIALLPTATDDLLGGKKWGVGPAGIVLKMIGHWTVGGLANHVWSVAGDSNRADISNTFVQPFVAYTWPNKWGVSLQSETTYNWKSEEFSVPVNLAVSKLVFFGKLPVSLQAGTGYWLKSATNGASGARFRLQANFVLPKF